VVEVFDSVNPDIAIAAIKSNFFMFNLVLKC